MNSRFLTVVFVFAAVAAMAVAHPLVQTRKGATPLPNEKPNTFRVDIAFRIVEEAGEDAQERSVFVTESLPPQVSLVSGTLAQKLKVKSVEVDAAPLDGWTNLEYVICADKVKFTLKNLTYDIVIRPTRFSIDSNEKEEGDVITSQTSDPISIRTYFPIKKATLFADFEYLTLCVYGIAVVLPVVLAVIFVKLCSTKPKNKEKKN